jgi:predicted phage tail protein
VNLINRARRAAIAAAIAVGVGMAGGAGAGSNVSAGPAALGSPPGPGAVPIIQAVATPTAPRSPNATAGTAKVKVTWLAPSSTGGATIDKYVVQRSRTGTSKWRSVGYPNKTSYTATGLNNGVRYYFRIRAHNAAGWGPYSIKVSAVPRSRSTAPRSPTATPGNTTVKLAWLAPSSTGGATIDKYVVQRSMTGTSEWKNVAYPTTRSFTATGLINGTKYYLRVRAHNFVGWSPASTVAYAVPRTLPSAPQSLVATAKESNQIRLDWLAPSSNGGAPIDNYRVQQATTAGGPWAAIADTETRDYITAMLSHGTRYYFRVRAHNRAGWGPYSPVADAVADAVPNAPHLVSGTVGDGTLAFSWYVPGNFPWMVYLFQVEQATSANGPWHIVASTSNTSYSATGLANFTTYHFRVSAKNALGISDYSQVWDFTPTKPATIPSAPTACTATQYGGPGYVTAYIDWNTPASDGGAPIINYHVDVWDNNVLIKSVDTADSSTDGLFAILPLYDPNGPSGFYNVQISARNQVGDGYPCETWLTMNP